MERLMLGGDFKPDTRQVPDTGMGRGKNHALDEIVRAVAADPAGIGYAGFANRLPGTRTLALAEAAGGPWYAGTRDEVARRVYPLTRTIFVFVRRPPGAPLDPALAAFLRFILSRQGQQAVADDPANFLPLPAGFAAGERARLN
jgi:phosphate transport system substrate-binding protein